MTALAVVGATFREVGFERLGELVLAEDDLPELARELEASELVCLQTCNRLELYLRSPLPLAELRTRLADSFLRRGAEVAPEGLLALGDGAALSYLFEVVSSLHSLVVGETEISGQARRALETARRLGLVGADLEETFARAVTASRRVRRETELGQLCVSVASLALQKVRKHFGPGGPRSTALVGVGAMTRKVAQTLRHGEGELWVVNRTLSRAEELAAACGGRALSLEAFQREAPDGLDLVFTATSAPSPVLGPDVLAPAFDRRSREQTARPLIVCDLGIPRDTDPALDAHPGAAVITLATMDRLAAANREALEQHVERARAIVAEEVTRTLREQRFTALAQTSARGLLAKRLSHLDPEDQETILKFAAGLASRMARREP